MINEGCGLLGTGDGIAWNGGRRGTGFFFAERETLKREMLKREMQKCKWLDNKKGA